MHRRRIWWAAVTLTCAAYAAAVWLLAPAARKLALEGECLTRASELAEEGDNDLVIAELERARDAGCNGPVVAASLGASLTGEHDYAQALPLLEHALDELSPETAGRTWRLRSARESARQALFECYVRTGDLDGARRIAASGADWSGSYVRLLLALGEFDLAEELIQKGMSGQSLEVSGWQRRSLQTSWVVVAVGRGDYATAAERWSKLTASGRQAQMAPLSVLVRESESALKARTSDDPKQAAQARVHLGEAYTRLGLLTSAVREFEAVDLALAPDPAQAWSLYADALEARGDRRPALDAWRRAAKADPHNADVRWKLARSLQRNGEFDDARQVLEPYVRDNPGRGLAWILLGDVARRQGDSERARAAYREGTALISAGRSSDGTGLTDAELARPISELIRASQHLAELARAAGAADDEISAWQTILDLSRREGRAPDDPPPDWLGEIARYRIRVLTGEEVPLLPGVDPDAGGRLLTVR